jgi:SAM-dependent methyltransferase
MRMSERGILDGFTAIQVSGGRTEYEQVGACDLCGSSDAVEVAFETAARCRTVLCTGCGLLYASPRLSRATLAHHYDEDFTGDAGSKAVLDGEAGAKRSASAGGHKLASRWALPLIKRHLDPHGADIINLRCRTGTLSAYLVREGAKVFSVDPFEANLDAARDAHGLSNLLLVPITDFENILIPGIDGGVDLIVALNVHVLAHLRSPGQFLRRMYEILKPGGYLILDEKDVLLPVQETGAFIFDSGKAHNYHFTQRTLARYAASVGFTVIECRVDKHRSTSFRHMVLVARKPRPGEQPRDAEDVRSGASDAAYIARRVRWLQRTWPLHQARARFRLSLRALARRARSVRLP